LCAVKDVFRNKIVGYCIDSRMKARIAVNALEMAVTHRSNPRCVVVHSDRGSMGQVGAAGDNAAMESFFSLLQKNVLDRQVWDTRDELRLAIVGWIEGKYHRKRRQRTLGASPFRWCTARFGDPSILLGGDGRGIGCSHLLGVVG